MVVVASATGPSYRQMSSPSSPAYLLSPQDVACNLRLASKGINTLLRTYIWNRAPVAIRRKLLCRCAAHHDLPSFQQVLSRATCGIDSEVFNAAASGGRLATCEWLVAEKGCSPTFETLDAAAEGGQLHVCQWLVRAHRVPFGNTLLDAAAKSGSKELVQWLLDAGCRCAGAGTLMGRRSSQALYTSALVASPHQGA